MADKQPAGATSRLEFWKKMKEMYLNENKNVFRNFMNAQEFYEVSYVEVLRDWQSVVPGTTGLPEPNTRWDLAENVVLSGLNKLTDIPTCTNAPSPDVTGVPASCPVDHKPVACGVYPEHKEEPMLHNSPMMSPTRFVELTPSQRSALKLAGHSYTAAKYAAIGLWTLVKWSPVLTGAALVIPQVRPSILLFASQMLAYIAKL